MSDWALRGKELVDGSTALLACECGSVVSSSGEFGVAVGGVLGAIEVVFAVLRGLDALAGWVSGTPRREVTVSMVILDEVG